MTALFEPFALGGLVLANRVAMAPLTRNRSPQAIPTPQAATYYAQRASAGLIISEGVAISQEGQGYSDVPGLYAPEQLAAWGKITDAVHAASGRIFAQLWHVGRVSHTSLQPGGGIPVAPSALQARARTFLIDARGGGTFAETSPPRALALEEMARVLDDYRRAAAAAVEQAGFDGVELHAANGYLIDQFLRSGSNRRTDIYGGSMENRVRFLAEAVDAIAETIGGQRLGVRLSPMTPSNDVEDADPQALFEAAARALAGRDIAYVHIVEGSTGGRRDLQYGDKSFEYGALKAAYRAAGGRGAWMVNNGYDRAMALEAVESGYADLVSFGRLFLANPDLVARLAGDHPMNPMDKATIYGGGEKGYTDYPAL